jgi:hypothetical protein
LDPLPEDKVRERILLLKRFLYHLEWDWPNEVKTKVSDYLNLPQNQPIGLEELARNLTDAQLEHLIQFSPVKDYLHV